MWKSHKSCQTVEEKFWELDFIIDDMLTAEYTPVVMIVGNTPSSSSSADF